MGARYYPFKVGNIACAVLLDGASPVSPERMVGRFPDIAEADMRRAYDEIKLSLDAADSSFNILMAKIGADVILVDSGEGGNPSGGLLTQSLALAGLAPDAVTMVVITHSDGDHVLGLLSDDGKAMFPKARYVISKEELAFWQRRMESGAADQRPILDMMRAQGLRLIDLDEQILPGFRAVPLTGHTPGHIGVRIESGNEKFMAMADVLHSPMQFGHPDWSPRFDVDRSLSVPTRRAALARAADQKLLTLFYHLTFPGLGRIQRDGDAFKWIPGWP
ncbi:MAG TPA: MBL fold metallo-hydrolase [Aggregatilineales bacterium]|nr:MBL fold metallo-hydrolase [Aggregatilineales bacterium]